jgi:hypothetical protein
MDYDYFYTFCFQGKVLQAIAYLDQEPDTATGESELREQYYKRFCRGKQRYDFQTQDLLLEEILNSYCEYYRQVLTSTPHLEAEKYLTDTLIQILSLNEGVDMENIENLLAPLFEERGYHYLGGQTLPYWGPYIWKNTEKEVFEVELSDGRETVNVFFLSDFLMLSWLHFATFGKYHTGGYAKPEGLYYIVPPNGVFDINAPAFQVSFLKHEARHLKDYRDFPELSGWELEYRAKLTELIHHPAPAELLLKFNRQKSEDQNNPHAYASLLLINNILPVLNIGEVSLSSLTDFSPLIIQQSALQLLELSIKPS